MINKEYLNPKSRLVKEVASWLCGNDTFPGRVKNLDGVYSLSHVLVVVPTSQSGRNLRLELAREANKRGWGGILPPKVVMSNTLLQLENERIANDAEELSVMASVLLECDIAEYKALFPRPPLERTADWALDMAGMILGVQSIISENALYISDVEPEIDSDRWQDLAKIENLFFKKLTDNGVRPKIVARNKAVFGGCPEDEIEEIVLPSALDIKGAFIKYLENSPQKISILIHADSSQESKFDEWGRPREIFSAEIPVEKINSYPTAVIEADVVAKHFRSIDIKEELPALVVCNNEMHAELEGAFQNYFSEKELVLRNPSREFLSKSALGRLLGAITRLATEDDYDTFSTLIRTGDIARWASNALGVDKAEISKYVGALDKVQNTHLPRTIAEVISGAATDAEKAREKERAPLIGLKKLVEAIKAELCDPLLFVSKIFSTITLDEKNPADRELIAAAKVVRELKEACSSDLVQDKFKTKLFQRLLKTSSFMLEPMAENILSSVGWLELPWCSEEELVITGFNEGAVPQNIVGHPFIPDVLRRELDLSTNAQREARDSFILAQAITCRARGAVSINMHQISGDKNVMKPSRILFNGISDRDLPSLAQRLYDVSKGGKASPPKVLPDAWRLKLPFPPKGTVFRENISPTLIDQYIRCPFNFYLQRVLGQKSDDRNQELDSLAFGTLCHDVLDQFAKTGPKDSTDVDEIASFLEAEVYRKLQVFGANPPAIITLQGEAAIERLKAFAKIQALRRKKGWRIIYSEQSLECRIRTCPTLIRGTVDRIDQHEETGEIAIIDYKTWRSDDASGRRKESVQLPLYRAMVETSGLFSKEIANTSKAFYCILAERSEDVKFDEKNACDEGSQSEAEEKILVALTDIAKGRFYPAKINSETEGWLKDYGALIWQSPEEGIDLEWIADQKRRLEEAQ